MVPKLIIFISNMHNCSSDFSLIVIITKYLAFGIHNVHKKYIPCANSVPAERLKKMS